MKTRFQIRISETQRKLLAVTLAHAMNGRHPMEVADGDAEEMIALHSMLCDLPEDDAEFEQEEALHDLAL